MGGFFSKGYISQALFDDLNATGVTFITDTRSNMKAKVLSVWDKMVLSKRFIRSANACDRNVRRCRATAAATCAGCQLALIGNKTRDGYREFS
ncbi:hypothetical protein VY86_15065 [Photorhabdus thracensis]|uniref:Transposase DDE domain-containing protein n=1 Tax=Photorhabdus thracensis TaxID=230089 RepID=A0A0F7LRI5_9GAMM|nr:hypothetical protein VY86_15065 [Photorhabdus thracensis]